MTHRAIFATLICSSVLGAVVSLSSAERRPVTVGVARLVADLGSEDPGTMLKAADDLVSMGPSAIPELVKGLSARNPQVRQAVPEVLVAIGPEAVPALCEALKVQDAIVQWGAVRGLRKLGPKATAAIPSLAGALRAKTSLATEAAWALEQMGDDAVPALIAALEDPAVPDEAGAMNARSSILSVLGRKGASAKQAVGAMARLLSHRDSFVRYSAAEALGALGPLATQALPQLRKAASDPEAGPREAAVRAIGRISRDQ